MGGWSANRQNGGGFNKKKKMNERTNIARKDGVDDSVCSFGVNWGPQEERKKRERKTESHNHTLIKCQGSKRTNVGGRDNLDR